MAATRSSSSRGEPMTGTELWAEKVVLIAGAAGGIGSATARKFHAGGARLALADRDSGRLKSLLQELGGNCITLPADISEPEACRTTVERTLASFGRLDVLINAAGVWVEGASDTMTEQQWDRTLDINLKGTFFACRYAI